MVWTRAAVASLFVGVATQRVYFTMMLGDTKKSDLRVIDVVPSTAVKLPEG